MSDTMTYVPASRIREAFKSAEMRTSSEAIEQVQAQVAEMLSGAVARAKANGRATVKAADI